MHWTDGAAVNHTRKPKKSLLWQLLHEHFQPIPANISTPHIVACLKLTAAQHFSQALQ
jgi:hypothetical protein